MDPFKILKIKYDADSAEIMKAVVVALKKKEYSAHQIVDAQKKLLHPLKRVYFTATQILSVPNLTKLTEIPKQIPNKKKDQIVFGFFE